MAKQPISIDGIELTRLLSELNVQFREQIETGQALVKHLNTVQSLNKLNRSLTALQRSSETLTKIIDLVSEAAHQPQRKLH